MSAASIRVVTVAYRSDDTIPGFLASVAGATLERARVTIVNNGPEPVSPLGMVDPRLEVDVIETLSNRGYGAGVNRGAAGAIEPWLIVSNPDLVFGSGAIDELITYARDHPEIGMVGPRVSTPGGVVYPSARQLPSLRNGIGHALVGKIWRSNPWTRNYVADHTHDSPRPAGWLSGSCFLIRGDVFREVGGFDESYFMYFEDVDLSARVAAAGYGVAYLPRAHVVHQGGASTRHASRAMLRAHHRSAYQYLARRYRGWALAPLRLALRIGLEIRAHFVRV